jgi:hypothetical protein
MTETSKDDVNVKDGHDLMLYHHLYRQKMLDENSYYAIRIQKEFRVTIYRADGSFIIFVPSLFDGVKGCFKTNLTVWADDGKTKINKDRTYKDMRLVEILLKQMKWDAPYSIIVNGVYRGQFHNPATLSLVRMILRPPYYMTVPPSQITYPRVSDTMVPMLDDHSYTMQNLRHLLLF